MGHTTSDDQLAGSSFNSLWSSQCSENTPTPTLHPTPPLARAVPRQYATPPTMRHDSISPHAVTGAHCLSASVWSFRKGWKSMMESVHVGSVAVQLSCSFSSVGVLHTAASHMLWTVPLTNDDDKPSAVKAVSRRVNLRTPSTVANVTMACVPSRCTDVPAATMALLTCDSSTPAFTRKARMGSHDEGLTKAALSSSVWAHQNCVFASLPAAT